MILGAENKVRESREGIYRAGVDPLPLLKGPFTSALAASMDPVLCARWGPPQKIVPGDR